MRNNNFKHKHLEYIKEWKNQKFIHKKINYL